LRIVDDIVVTYASAYQEVCKISIVKVLDLVLCQPPPHIMAIEGGCENGMEIEEKSNTERAVIIASNHTLEWEDEYTVMIWKDSK